MCAKLAEPLVEAIAAGQRICAVRGGMYGAKDVGAVRTSSLTQAGPRSSGSGVDCSSSRGYVEAETEAEAEAASYW